MGFSSWLTPALLFASQIGPVRSNGPAQCEIQFLACSSLALGGQTITRGAGSVAIIAPGIVANKQWARGRHELRLNQPRFGGAFLWRQRRVQPCWQAF
jgi:hypothetical protein